MDNMTTVVIKEEVPEIDVKEEVMEQGSDEEADPDETVHGNGEPDASSPIKNEKSDEKPVQGEISTNGDTPNPEECSGNQFMERYMCHHCDKSYKNIRSLNQHFREVQVCRVCKLSLPSVEEFTSHILEDHTVGALCGLCMNSFRSRSRLVEHVRTHTQLTLKKPEVNRVRKITPAESSRTCKLCKQDLSPLSPHTCHANVCKVCRKPLRTRSEFEMHMMRLHCTDDLCQFCGVRLNSLPSLISHLKSHTSLRFPVHKCLKCGLRFGNTTRLEAHTCQPMRQLNSGSEQPFLCKVSSGGNAYAWDSPTKNLDLSSAFAQDDLCKSIKEDVLKHHCEFCNKKFRYVKELKQHRTQVHTCRICQKVVKTQNEFETHMMQEHSSKDECQFCQRKFICANALRNHLKIHTSISYTLYQCKKCNEKFKSLKEKSKHECTRYFCLYCEDAFETESKKDIHTREQHPTSNLFKCNTCSQVFGSSQVLKRHIAQKHKKKTEK